MLVLKVKARDGEDDEDGKSPLMRGRQSQGQGHVCSDVLRMSSQVRKVLTQG